MIVSLENLVDALSKLPSIGRKSAWRLALHLLERENEQVYHLAQCLREIKEKIVLCKECFNFSESEICSICCSPKRNKSLICVVEKPVDVFTIEKSGKFQGLYHVLGGVLSPIHGITADKLRIAELRQRVIQQKPEELILALGGSADAETTSLYLTRIFTNEYLHITRLARGLPAGIDLEYVDQLTLCQALNERTEIPYFSGNEDIP